MYNGKGIVLLKHLSYFCAYEMFEIGYLLVVTFVLEVVLKTILSSFIC